MYHEDGGNTFSWKVGTSHMHDTIQKSKDVHHDTSVTIRIISLLSVCGGKESISNKTGNVRTT